MMSKRAWLIGFLFTVCLSLAFSGSSQAFYIDEAKTFEVSAKAQTRASLRTQDTDSEANGRGWCYPDIKAGDFVQHRNLALVEINHDLQNLTKSLDVLYPFRALGINAKYHIVGRFVYDGIYDYGPEILRDVRDADRENVDHFKQSYDLWECYADLSQRSGVRPDRETEPRLGRNRHFPTPGRHQPSRQQLRGNFRGPRRPQDSSLDAPLEREPGLRGPCILVHPGRLSRARQDRFQGIAFTLAS
jgi:hypothetical protein